jgi:hypothetical protein
MGAVAVGAVLLGSAPAHATQVRLGLGANYWFDQGGLFDVNVSVLGRVTRRVQVGGRFGAFLATDPNTLGVPINILLRGNFDNLYIEGMAGPWIRFEDDPLLGHVAFGFGIQGSGVALGLEVGYLDPDPIAGLKLSFAF